MEHQAVKQLVSSHMKNQHINKRDGKKHYRSYPKLGKSNIIHVIELLPEDSYHGILLSSTKCPS